MHKESVGDPQHIHTLLQTIPCCVTGEILPNILSVCVCMCFSDSLDLIIGISSECLASCFHKIGEGSAEQKDPGFFGGAKEETLCWGVCLNKLKVDHLATAPPHPFNDAGSLHPSVI